MASSIWDEAGADSRSEPELGEGLGRLSDMLLLYVPNGLCVEGCDRSVCRRSLPGWVVLGLGARV